jgi:hypothetical protein
MKISDYRKLCKCMQQTFSDNDHEALAAIRAANGILKANGDLTWDRVFARTINVINEVEEDPERAAARPRNSADSDLIAAAEAQANRDWDIDFIISVQDQFRTRHFLTDKQRDVLRRISGDR